MNIGVFGDSYCDRNLTKNKPSWFELLRNHGHKVTSYGAGGSSTLYSAKLIEKHAAQYDFVIWCATNPMRLSIQIDESPHNLHFTASNSHDQKHFTLDSSKVKCNLASNYYHQLLEIDDDGLVCRSLINYQLQKRDNLMIIPCFYDPLATDFNLYNVCEQEAQYYFPSTSIPEVYLTFNDIRRCHLSIDNNQILSDLVAANLSSGVFQTEYSHFNYSPSEELSFYFSKVK